MIEVVNLAWVFIITLVSSIIWFIRLEAKVLYLVKDHEKLAETSAKTDLLFQSKVDTLIYDLNKIQVSLTRIETKISMHNRADKHKEE